MAKSYYAILGISSMATTDEVRAAYRRLAKAYHPDLYHGNSDNFRQIQEAYNVLGNAERRRQYAADPLSGPICILPIDRKGAVRNRPVGGRDDHTRPRISEYCLPVAAKA